MTATRLEPGRDLVAYFCAEYGVHERLPLYSGGLGVLAGDHCKTAGDLKLPLVAVGLFYREGYFNQVLDGAGRQQAQYAPQTPKGLGLEAACDAGGQPLRIRVPMQHHGLQLAVWHTTINGTPLVLLDSDLPENHADDRSITHRLYGGGSDHRLRQEIVLGIGGVRALRALGHVPTVWHLNEGHAALAILERIHEEVTRRPDFEAALEKVAANSVFTTHTPVAAGHDVFNHGQLRHFLGTFLGELHTPERRVLELGADAAGGDRFSMTALALRGTRFHNGVSRIHGGVASEMESYIWPQVAAADNPLQSITNAVHVPTFLAPEWQRRLDARTPNWRGRGLAAADCAALVDVADAELVALRRAIKRRLLDDLRERLNRQHQRNGTPADVVTAITRQLDADPLVLGFARRFATYKRATLLLADDARMARLLGDPARPVLLVFAGKAHPHDHGGQDLLQQLYQHSLRPEFIGRLLVVEGYDLALARSLVQGADVWLNTPQYPLEASGTSGMKSAINGGVNVSVADGWWAEAHDGSNGFAVAPTGDDASEASQLMEILENTVLPSYFSAEGGYGPQWLPRVRAAAQSVSLNYQGARMLNDYVRKLYAPAAAHGRTVTGTGVRAYARWKRMVRARWPKVELAITSRAPLRVSVSLHGLHARDLAVEWLPAQDGAAVPLPLLGEQDDRAEFGLPGDADPGNGVVRAHPVHDWLAHRFEMGCLVQAPLP